MKYRKVVCYDLEMCCWEDSPVGEIIEFSLVEVDLIEEKITRSNQYIVTPENDEVSQYCYELTGHSNKKVKKQGRDLSSVINTIKRKYSLNKPFIAWGKDEKTLESECERKGIDFELYNPVNLALVFNMLNASERKYSQDDVLEFYNIDPQGKKHVAIHDAHNLAKILLEMRKQFKLFDN